MIVLNSQSSERMPTVQDELVNSFPMDDNLKCLVPNPRYARVLIIKAKGSRLYDYFQKMGSLITMLTVDPVNEEINVGIGRYNIVAIDLEGQEINKGTKEKFAKLAKDNRVSILVNCANMEEEYILGGHKVIYSYYLQDSDIANTLSSSLLYNQSVNLEIADSHIRFKPDSFADFSLDTRIKMFTLSLDVIMTPKPVSGVGTMLCIYTGTTPLLSLEYEFDTRELYCIINKVKHSICNLNSLLINKITLTSDGTELKIYVADKLVKTIDIVNESIKGTGVIIGKNIKSSQTSVMDMLVKDFNIFGKALSKKEVTVLAKGRFIMV